MLPGHLETMLQDFPRKSSVFVTLLRVTENKKEADVNSQRQPLFLGRIEKR
jgi:hypothetical protein